MLLQINNQLHSHPTLFIRIQHGYPCISCWLFVMMGRNLQQSAEVWCVGGADDWPLLKANFFPISSHNDERQMGICLTIRMKFISLREENIIFLRCHLLESQIYVSNLYFFCRYIIHLPSAAAEAAAPQKITRCVFDWTEIPLMHIQSYIHFWVASDFHSLIQMATLCGWRWMPKQIILMKPRSKFPLSCYRYGPPWCLFSSPPAPQ